ncbi:MAG: DUF2332 family protein [Acidimicrobiales bacterium]
MPRPADGRVAPIAERVGLDRTPIDVTDDESVRWLEACVFPDRLDRLHRLQAAVALVRPDPPRVEAGDAVADLARVAATLVGSGPSWCGTAGPSHTSRTVTSSPGR